MKIVLKPEYDLNVRNLYGVSTVNGYLQLKRKKDVTNLFYHMQKQANDYLKELLLHSSELEYLLFVNISKISGRDVRDIVKSRNFFYERLKYLTSYEWVVSLYKMNSLYTMTVDLRNIAIILNSKKHIDILNHIETQFFVNRQYYKSEIQTLKINENGKKTSNEIKTKSMLSISPLINGLLYSRSV